MGGVSTGKFTVEKVNGILCYRMIGDVSTKNNGGFIQMRTKLSPEINSKDYDGVYVKVYGNEKNYNLHLRTGLTLVHGSITVILLQQQTIGLKLEHHLNNLKNLISINLKVYWDKV